jgi:hypothetical protein
MNAYGLVIDCIAMVPVFYLQKLVMLPKTYKTFMLLFKLVKCFHLPKILIEIYEHRKIPKYVNFIGYIVAFYFVTHFFCCLMYYFVVEKYLDWKKDPSLHDIRMIWIPPSYRNIELEDDETMTHAELFFESSTFHKFSLILYSVTFVIKGGEFGPITKMEAALASAF